MGRGAAPPLRLHGNECYDHASEPLTGSENGLLWSGGPNLREGTGTYTISNSMAGAPAFTTDGYHLTKASSAIDHGVNSGISSDIDGNPRPWGPAYNLGAAEYPRYRAFLPLVQRQ